MERRIEVEKFADLMEKVLKENDYKGTWKNCELEYLIECLNGEVEELQDALLNIDFADNEQIEGIIKECADVANFAMMIADNTSRAKDQ